MEDFPEPRDFLADARHDFSEFYQLATEEEIMQMDGLVLMHAALVARMNVPREYIPRITRGGFERDTDTVERLFTGFREGVRACPTFQLVSDTERFAIETVAFAVRVPGTE